MELLCNLMAHTSGDREQNVSRLHDDLTTMAKHSVGSDGELTTQSFVSSLNPILCADCGKRARFSGLSHHICLEESSLSF
jgi:hypothetical protein